MIPYSHQSIDEDDVAAVVAALKGDWLTQGPHVQEFEEALAGYVGAAYAVAFANGTAALHAAVSAAGLGPGDIIATSALSFVASANCGRYAGSSATFVDISEATLNLAISQVPQNCDGLVAVHFAGLPVDLSALNFRPRVIIEDAAHALGAMTPDGPVGNCARSDMCAFSFHPVKAITTGEGGIVTTNSEEFRDSLRKSRHHGIVPKPSQGGWYYEIESLGFNYRMTDMQAALGCSQLTKAERFIARRNELAERYRSFLADLPLILPPAAPQGWRHAYHLFPIRVDERGRVYENMRAAGIGVQVHYVPIYRHPLYADPSRDDSAFPATEAAYESLLSLPIFPDLSESDQDRVMEVLAGEIG